MFKAKTENNRAVFGDVVAFEISPFEMWETKAVKTIAEEQKEEIEIDAPAGADVIQNS